MTLNPSSKNTKGVSDDALLEEMSMIDGMDADMGLSNMRGDATGMLGLKTLQAAARVLEHYISNFTAVPGRQHGKC